jgi:Lipopolysaccharide assembly protein A domain
MFRRLLTAIVLIPIFIALVAWAVANPQPVTVSFDPFDAANPAYAVTKPLYLVGFAILIAGVVLGGIAAWLEQGKWRRAHARLGDEIAVVRAELEILKRQPTKAESRALAHASGPIARGPSAA